MQQLSYPRVAVIGGGIAGVGAAWALNRSGIKFELFEQASSLGGHARTMEIPTSVGPRCIAPATRCFFDNIYFNFFELLRQAGVPYESTTWSFAHQDAEGQAWSNTGAKTALGCRLDNEQRRFTAAMLKGLTPEEFGSDIASYLASHGYSEEFTTKVVRPWIVQLTTVPITEVGMDVMFFQLAMNTFSFFRPMPMQIMTGCDNRHYFDALVRGFKDRVHLNVGVASLGRTSDGVVLVDDKGGKHYFDEAIITVNTAEALEMLSDPTDEERRLLGDMTYEHVKLYIHNDAQRLVNDDPSIFTHTRSNNDVTYSLNALIPEPFDPPILITQESENQDLGLDPSHVLGVVDVTYASPTLHNERVRERLHQLQGVDRVHYAGYAISNGWHEGALVSGFVAAEQCGAQYHLADNPLANESAKFFRQFILTGHKDVVVPNMTLVRWLKAALPVLRFASRFIQWVSRGAMRQSA